MEPGHPAGPGDGWVRLAAGHDAPGAARRHVTQWLAAHHAGPDAVRDLAVAVSELATNVVCHARTEWVHIRMSDDDETSWTLEVVVGTATLPPPLADPASWGVADPGASHGGRGLGLVRAAADEIEVAECDGRWVVRCRRERIRLGHLTGSV